MRDLRKILTRLKILFLIGKSETSKLKLFDKIKKLRKKKPDLFENASESEKIENKENSLGGSQNNSLDDSSIEIVERKDEEKVENIAAIIQDYELWGPFLFTMIFCFLASLINGLSSQENSFIIFIGIIWSANCVIYVNSRLLLARISFMQMISVLGYSLFPLSLAALLCLFLRNILHFVLIWLIIIFILLFASIVTRKLLNEVVSSSKLTLIWFPIFLYHLTLGFLMVSTSHHLK